ncbi:MAG: M48 family metallopeptidase [Smithella sp.]
MTNRRSTNFFTRQEQARSNCRNLVVVFIVALLAIIIAIYFAFRLICYINLSTNVFTTSETATNLMQRSSFLWWDPAIFILVFIGVILFIFTAGIIKMRQLQKGGGAVAKMLGGRCVAKSTNIPAERQLLNVVEEMAIAAGIPVPEVYILEKETGINAFAAGLTINDAAVAVTQGALEKLNRDELQGVVAHEFSHILNGDMRLNIQLMGIIYGILIVGIIGGEILDNHRISSKSIVLFIAGLLLTIIGYIGTFTGRLIQSAVSRQKEFLADASAVKFTRNPLGLASALKKIGGYIYGSQITSPTALQASHLFFGKSGSDFLFPDFLATHPPLSERILLLDPSFDGIYPRVEGDGQTFPSIQRSSALSAMDNSDSPSPGLMPATVKATDIVDCVCSPNLSNLQRVSDILSSIPQQLKDMLNTPAGSAILIYALLTGNKCAERELQLSTIARSFAAPGNNEDFLYLCELAANLKDEQKLPLVELALPSLRQLSVMERTNLLETVDSLIQADGEITLFEFSLQWIVQQYLSKNGKAFEKTGYSHISQVGYHILIVLRALANAGNRGNSDAAQLAFNAGVSRIPELACKSPDYYYTENINFVEINTALKKLNCSSFKIKQLIVDACAHCVFADKTVTAAEAELLRVISLALHCPLPPFTPHKSMISNTE